MAMQKLLDALDELDSTQLNRFRTLLTDKDVLQGFGTISRGKLENKDTTDVTSIMLQTYGDKDAMKIAQIILIKMKLKPLADKFNTEPNAAAAGMEDDAAAFVDKHRAQLIQRVTSVMPIADVMLTKKILNQEKYSEISTTSTTQGKMRKMYSYLDSAGAKGKTAFYEAVLQEEPFLVEDLRN